MDTLSEAKANRDHPLYHHDVTPLDFSSVLSLPDSHAWPQSDDDNFSFNGCPNGSGAESSIPIIDLMDPNAMELIGLACEKWGVFQLKNHGIPMSLIEDVEQEAKRLFALPTEQKLKALRPAGGLTGYGKARIASFFPKAMWHEGFTIVGSPSNDAKKFWPSDYARFCDVMENYQKQVKVLAEKLTHMLFDFLDISEEDKKWVGSPGDGPLQLNSYPCCPDPNRAMGLGPHTDTSLLTILHQGQITGLEIFNEEAGWIPVHPLPNTLVVNTGDLLHIISNARFHCVLHRAAVNRTKQRYSVAYFYLPPLDYVIPPLSSRAVNSVARFRALTVKEYVGIKAQNNEEALSKISI